MEVIFILLPLAILIAGVMLALFIWAVRSGQYDDLETPAHRILFDDNGSSTRAKPRASHDVDAPDDPKTPPSDSCE